MDLLLELDAPVEYIVLTTHAYEHKVFVPSFQRRFPQAQVYYSPKCAPSPPAVLCLWELLVNVNAPRALHSKRRHIRRVLGLYSGDGQYAVCVPYHLLAFRPTAMECLSPCQEGVQPAPVCSSCQLHPRRVQAVVTPSATAAAGVLWGKEAAAWYLSL